MVGSAGRRLMCSLGISFGVTCGLAACQSADSDRTARRRDAARQMCESAVLDQLPSRATATFSGDKEHVFYDSTGGAGVTGVVATASGPRDFACILKPATDSTWGLSASRLMN